MKILYVDKMKGLGCNTMPLLGKHIMEIGFHQDWHDVRVVGKCMVNSGWAKKSAESRNRKCEAYRQSNQTNRGSLESGKRLLSDEQVF